MTRQADLLRDKRRHFALPGGSHDRTVRWLAILLPAGIGAVLAIMIIAPLFPRGEISFLLDRNKVATTEDRLRVTNALYRGEDGRGRAFSVTAGSAFQRSAATDVVELSGLAAKILLSDGPAEITAPNGTYQVSQNALEVRGPVDLRGANNYQLATGNVHIDLKKQQVTGTGGVTGTAPSGTFSADRIEADLENRTVALQGRARLTMQGRR
jgi:lipopolysaccharide export system protein LptC